MKEKICLITGGNSGIGKATAIELAKLGATVVLLCRSEERGQTALREIVSQTGNHNVGLIIADLASQSSVRQAVDEFKRKYNKLDVLINNAAVFLPNRSETEDGIETTFATNYIFCLPTYFWIQLRRVGKVESSMLHPNTMEYG